MLRLTTCILSLFLLAGSALGAKSICLSGDWDFLPIKQAVAPQREGVWLWDNSQTFNDVFSHVSEPAPLERHSIIQASPVLVDASAVFRQAVRLDPADPPSAIAIRFHVFDTNTWTAAILFAEPGQHLPDRADVTSVTPARGLPRPGQWMVLEMPTEQSSAGLSGKYIDGAEFFAMDGRVYWGETSLTDASFGDRDPAPFPFAKDAAIDPARHSWLKQSIPVPGAWCNPDPELGGVTQPYANFDLPLAYKRIDEAMLRTRFESTPILYGLNPEVGVRLRFTGGVNHHGAYKVNDSPWFALDLPLTPCRSGDIRPWLRQGWNEITVRLRRCPRDAEGNPLEPAGGTWAYATGGIPGDVFLEEYQPVTPMDVSAQGSWAEGACEVSVRSGPAVLAGQEWSKDEFESEDVRLAAMKAREIAEAGVLQAGRISIHLASGGTTVSETWSGGLPTGGDTLKTTLKFIPDATEMVHWTPETPVSYGIVFDVTPDRGSPYRFARRFAFADLPVENGRVMMDGKPRRIVADEWEFLGPGTVKRETAQAGYRILKDIGANAVILRGLPVNSTYSDAALDEGILVFVQPGPQEAESSKIADYLKKRLQDEYLRAFSGFSTYAELSTPYAPDLRFVRVFEGFDAFGPFEARDLEGESAIGLPPSFYKALGEHYAQRIVEEREKSTANLIVSPLINAAVKPMPAKDVSPLLPGQNRPGWRPAQFASLSLPLPPGYDIPTEVTKRADVYDPVQEALKPLHVRIVDPPRTIWSEEETTRSMVVTSDLPAPATVTLTLSAKGNKGGLGAARETHVIAPGETRTLSFKFQAPRAFDVQQVSLTARAAAPAPNRKAYQANDEQKLNLFPVTFRQQILTRSRTKPAYFGGDESSRTVLSRWFTNIQEAKDPAAGFERFNLIFVLPGAITPENGDAVQASVESALQEGKNVVILQQDYAPKDFPWKGAQLVDCRPTLTTSSGYHVFLYGVDVTRLTALAESRTDFCPRAWSLPDEGYYLSFLEARSAADTAELHPSLTAGLRMPVWPGTLYVYQLPVSDAEPDSLHLFSRFCMEARDNILWRTNKPRTVLLERDSRSQEMLDSLDWQYETVTRETAVASIPSRVCLLFLDGAIVPDASEQAWMKTFMNSGRRVFVNASGVEPMGYSWLPDGMSMRPFFARHSLPTRYGRSSLTEGLLLDDAYQTGAKKGFTLVESDNPPLLVTHEGWSIGWEDEVSDTVRPMALERSLHESWGIHGMLTYFPRESGGVIVSTLDITPERMSELPVRRTLAMLLSNAEAVYTGFSDRLVSPPPETSEPVAQSR